MIGRIVAIVVGLWLMASPSVLGYGSPAAEVDRIVGPVVASLSVIALSEVMKELRWALLPLGAVLLLTPIPLGYEQAGIANSVACGVILMGASFLTTRQRHRMGGGWKALV